MGNSTSAEDHLKNKSVIVTAEGGSKTPPLEVKSSIFFLCKFNLSYLFFWSFSSLLNLVVFKARIGL
jgi:hypothetical protein